MCYLMCIDAGFVFAVGIGIGFGFAGGREPGYCRCPRLYWLSLSARFHLGGVGIHGLVFSLIWRGPGFRATAV